MRAVVLAWLVVASGCDAIFGIKTALLRDAPPAPDGVPVVPDAPPGSMFLTRQVLENTTGTIDYPTIAGADIEVGPIDPADGPLRQLAIDGNGAFQVPLDLMSGPFRLVYRVDADAPTEVRSPPVGAHFVVPLFGRVARVPPPTFTIVEFNPANKGGSYVNPRVYTTGIWTSFDYSNVVGGPSLDYAYQQYAVTLSGSLGSPVGSNGDLEVLVDCTNEGASAPVPGVATAFAVMQLDHLNQTSDGPAMGTPPWVDPATSVGVTTSSIAWSPPPSGPNGPVSRMTAALGASYDSLRYSNRTWGGVIPSDQMPNFIEPNPGGLDVIAMFDLATTSDMPHMFVNPFDGGADHAPVLPLAVLTEDSDSRIISGLLTLTSGFHQIVAAPTGGGTAALAYDVGIAHATNQDVTLAPSGIPANAMILTGGDGKLVTLGGAKLAELTFGTDRPVDDCIATLYTVGTTSVTPVRHFLLRQPPIPGLPLVFDASVFDNTDTYVFGIVCRKGFGALAQMDYTVMASPYSFATSTFYSSTFMVAP